MRQAIETVSSKDFSVISEYYITKSSEKLSEHHQKILNRWQAADRILMKFPTKSIAARKLQAQFPEISIRQAQVDIDNACKFWNLVSPADKGFLIRFLIEHIVNAIKKDEVSHAIKVKYVSILERLQESIQEEQIDPKLMEKNTVNIQFNISGNNIVFSEKELNTIPKNIRQKLLSLTSSDITEADAIEILTPTDNETASL
jgi:hypothetical protein